MVWTADRIPVLKTYEEALAHYNDVTPYNKRSNVAGAKPWGYNRKYPRSIIRLTMVDGVENVVVCSYYATDVVSYFPDGTIKLSQTQIYKNGNGETSSYLWDSVSTALIIGAALSQHSKVHRVNARNYYVDSKGEFHLIKGGITIMPDGEVKGATPEYVYTLRKSRMAELRKKYKAFTDYTTLMLTFSDDVSGFANADSNIGNKLNFLTTDSSILGHYSTDKNKADCYAARDMFFTELDAAITETDDSKRMEKFYPLFASLATKAGERRWIRAYVNNSSTMQNTFTCDPLKLREYFYELIRYEYAYELFDMEAADKTKPARIVNKKYVNFGRTVARQ